ncbi:MAG: TRAP transporter large permease subunit, partial [Bacteroidota bacterium]|nr:TRAP transporter large permease subunit [Kiloniellaceae bacterium]
FALYRDVSLKDAYIALLASARASASIGVLIGGSLVFNYVVTIENIPIRLNAMLQGYALSPEGFLLLVNVILLVLGCLLEGITILLVIVPIFIPIAQALGIDMVHFGVVVVVNLMIGLVTPPYGLLLFIVASVAETPLWPVVRDILPFLVSMIAALALITFVPEVVLWLPRLLGYGG